MTRDELDTLTELETPATVRNLTRLARLNRLGMVAQQGRSWTLTDIGRSALNAW